MNILLSAFGCGAGQGSEPGVGWNWSRALADAGHEVTVLTTERYRDSIDEALARRSDGRLRVVYVPIPPMFFAKGQVGVYLKYLVWQWAAYRRARRLVDERDIDVVHHISWGSLQLGTWMGRLPRPLVFGPVGGGQTAPSSLRDFYVGDWRTEAIRTFVTRRLTMVDPFARMAVRRAQLVLANNHETARLAQRLGAAAVAYDSELGLHPEDIAERPTPEDAGPLRLLWVGRLMARKGLPLALAAVEAASHRVPVRLTIIGGGPQLEHVQRWVDQLGITELVDVRGQVPFDHVQAAYRDHDALLFTSLRDSTGSQLLEAMAAGTPVIALAHSGAAVLVDQDRGLLVPPTGRRETLTGMADAIERLAREPDLRRRLRAGALEYAHGQSWASKAESMTQRYASLAASPPRPGPSGIATGSRP